MKTLIIISILALAWAIRILTKDYPASFAGPAASELDAVVPLIIFGVTAGIALDCWLSRRGR